MHDLLLRGELVPDPGVPPYTWVAPDGFTVTVSGRAVEATWHSAPDDSGAFDVMRNAVGDLVLLETLRRITPLEVTWGDQQVSTPGVLGGHTIFSPGISTGAWTARHPPTRLDAHTTDAAGISSHPELREALDNFRNAMLVWMGDAKDAQSRLYLAAEAVVFAVAGDSARSDWNDVGTTTGFGDKRARQLYDNLQFGRHVNGGKALARIAKDGTRQLTPHECLLEVGEFIETYRKWLT